MATTGARARIDSIDLVRGLVMVIMALDHVRDYFHGPSQHFAPEDLTRTDGWLFFTRWITHYCAPVFVFLAGTSAGLMSSRKTPSALGAFLFKRGLWLIFVEVSIVATAWSFAPWGLEQLGGRTGVVMQVIWAIGASMVVLSGAQWLGQRACLFIGVAIVAGHNLLDPIWPATTGPFDTAHPLWVALHAQMAVAAAPFYFACVYPLLPWTGVMLFGFGVSMLFERPDAARNASLVKWGLALTAAFLVLRALDLYGDPNHWESQARGPIATVIDVLNTTKYPPSLDFVLMTLGPAAILCAFAEKVHSGIRGILTTFGRVPFAFYIAHVILIHTLSVLLGVAQGFRASQFMTLFLFYPQGYGVSLLGVYVVWAVVIATLYPYCRWMAGVKARRRDWWLSYV